MLHSDNKQLSYTLSKEKEKAELFITLHWLRYQIDFKAENFADTEVGGHLGLHKAVTCHGRSQDIGR